MINILRKMGNGVGVAGIYGTAGIGKTALAKEIYNQEQANFKLRCFLKDVKGTGAVIDLQKRMVMDFLRVDVKEMPGDFATWFEKIQKKKVLLVIDDISDRKQFDELILDLKVLAPGSLVIIKMLMEYHAGCTTKSYVPCPEAAPSRLRGSLHSVCISEEQQS